jgi:hypothetical protein
LQGDLQTRIWGWPRREQWLFGVPGGGGNNTRTEYGHDEKETWLWYFVQLRGRRSIKALRLETDVILGSRMQVQAEK